MWRSVLPYDDATRNGYEALVCAASVAARTAASSAAPRKVADLRLRWKWTPMKWTPGTTVLEPLLWTGKPRSSNASGKSTQLV